MRTEYRIDDFQEVYFVIDRFEDLLDLARIDFGPTYDRVKAMPDVGPGAALPGDGLTSRGTGAYHAARQKVP